MKDLKKLVRKFVEDRERYIKSNISLVCESLIKYESNNLDGFETLWKHDEVLEFGEEEYDVEVYLDSDNPEDEDEFIVPTIKPTK